MIGVRVSLLYAALAASTTLVRAHGSVSGVAANGKEYGAPFPGSGADSDSPVRVISTLEPIGDPHSQAMTCGHGAANSAKAIAEVTAGTDFTFSWRSGEQGINWPHRLGPVMLYAYKCPGPANECKPSADDKGWALIDAAGYDVQRNGELWVQERFFNGESVPAPVPAGMPDGDYLFRHEIVALHRIPCEFYVSCTQVRIVGGASANMSLADAGAELVSFPGGYSGSEPGVTANVFGGVNKDTYQFPGPKLFNPSKSSSPPPETSDPEPTSTEDDSPEPTATSTEEGSSEPTSPAPSPTLTEDEPTATPTQCKMTRKQRRELRKARKARREMRKRAIAGREAHRRHKAALAALR